MHNLLGGVNFPECDGCSKCCCLPWLLREEYSAHKKKFGKVVKRINSIAFIKGVAKCKLIKKDRCCAYKYRPLDCRLFPLDLIEEKGKYWWGVFTICPQHDELKKKLIPLIPKLEVMITREIFEQYKRQIMLTKKIYPPFKLGLYKKIKKFRPGFV